MRVRLPRWSRLTIAIAALLAGCGDAATAPDDREPLRADAELATARDPAEAAVDPAWDAWIRDHHHTVRSLSSTRTDDLRFFQPLIGARRIVQLGESGHGVREFNLAEVRLIRFLHEEMGFDVLAFESGLFECWRANELVGSTAPAVTMNSCVFGVWSTHEVLALFEYIRETRGTGRPLVLAGVDVQLSGSASRRFGPDFLAGVVAHVDPAYAERVRTFDDAFHRDYGIAASSAPFDPAGPSRFIAEMDARSGYTARYDSLASWIDANLAALSAAHAAGPDAPLVTRQMARSRIHLSQGGSDPSFVATSTRRDLGMADNVDFLLDRLYPGKKMIVWAHNPHIMHDRASLQSLGPGGVFPQSMGAFIAQRRRPELYTIGRMMYRGQAANNGGQVYDIQPPRPNSLEAVLYRPRKQWVFVDLLHQTRSAGTSWMFDVITGKEWGTNEYRFAPRAQYDGILFIDTVNPPRYYVSSGRDDR